MYNLNYNTPNACRVALKKVSASHHPQCSFFLGDDPRCSRTFTLMRRRLLSPEKFYHKRHLSDVQTKIQIHSPGFYPLLRRPHSRPHSSCECSPHVGTNKHENQTHNPRRARPSASVLLQRVWARLAPRQPLHLFEGRQAAHEVTEWRVEASRYVMSGKKKKLAFGEDVWTRTWKEEMDSNGAAAQFFMNPAFLSLHASCVCIISEITESAWLMNVTFQGEDLLFLLGLCIFNWFQLMRPSSAVRPT